jgi:uncharacterized protein YeeX (DUF496 family)
MSFDNLNFTQLKTKVQAYRDMENTLGKKNKFLDIQDRKERKRLMLEVLGIKQLTKINEKVENFDYKMYENLLVDFFSEIGVPNVFTEIQIVDLPQGMFIKMEPPTLYIEQRFVENSDERFAPICIFHELYHKFGQNMNPNMCEVKYMTDYFGQQTIVEMDIDADVETYTFIEQKNNINFKDYLGMIYDGLSLNRDETPRIYKVARFVGSIVSIYFKKENQVKAILYPHINKINDGQIVIACIYNGRKYAKINMSFSEVESVISLYKEPNDVDKETFVHTLENFCISVSSQIKPQLIVKNSNI